ncbi:MAG: GspE/PulE family protein [Planctomycetota bacterium]|jgi:type II secretory ATPase GspE/PulE/Tfp pilus assembly ATPase PilB-like protein
MQLSLIYQAFPASLTAQLPFSPIRLIALVIWVYLCLYCVQVVQFCPLVPKNRKSIAVMATFFTGPALLLVLHIVDIARKSSSSSESTLQIAGQRMRDALDYLRTGHPHKSKGDSQIQLLDSAGRSIHEVYGHKDKKKQKSSILNLTEWIVSNALNSRASDILIDPADESDYTVRLRIDGVLRTLTTINSETAKAVLNSIKAVSGMDIAEKRRPQDGAFKARMPGANASFRVASAGVLYGEKIAIRVLNQTAGTFHLADMNLPKKQHATIKKFISKPSGMVLMCGPTGSGKTTTMYAMLNEIDRMTRNVITVEDPIEAVLSEASQIEINPKADITFAKTLRNILRQDPDVICIGEIRDEETAEIALRAAQTGHLVLATVHCDSNAMALTRLLDLGVSPVLLSSGLNLLVSQRLLRKLCEHCKKPARLSPGLIAEFTKKRINYRGMYEAKSCRKCDGTGYYGRIAICDPLVVDDEMRANIAENTALLTELRTQGSKRDKVKLRLKRVIG